MENLYFNLGPTSEREKRIGKPTEKAPGDKSEPTENVIFDKWITVDGYDFVLLSELCRKFDLEEADLLTDDGLDLLNKMAERKGVFPVKKISL